MPTMPKARINEAGGMPGEGWHRVRVAKVEEKRSGKGDLYYNLELETESDGRLWDVVMLEGKGNGLGFAKLEALGATRDLGDEIEYDWPTGCRAWCHVVHERYDGKPRAKVNIREGMAGYLPADSNPPEVAGGEAGGDTDYLQDDDIPF